MPQIDNHPVPYTVIGTLVSAAISYGVTVLAMSAAGLPMLAVAGWLAVGLPATIAPLMMYPLILMVRRQRRLRAELERLLLTDMLTELPNRRAFFGFAGPLIERRAESDLPLAAMMIDVDHFKQINDTHGHDAGDAVLKRIGDVINREVSGAGATDWTVARIGGEEFAVLIDGVAPSAVGRLAERICGQVRRSVGVGAGQVSATVSVGVAFRGPGMGIDKLLKASDDAVYVAKRAGRDRWAFAGDEKRESDRSRRAAALRNLPEPANDHGRAVG